MSRFRFLVDHVGSDQILVRSDTMADNGATLSARQIVENLGLECGAEILHRALAGKLADQLSGSLASRSMVNTFGPECGAEFIHHWPWARSLTDPGQIQNLARSCPDLVRS